MRFGKHELTFPVIEGTSAETKVTGRLKITEERPMYLVVETILSSDAVVFKPLFKEWNNFDQSVITSDNIQGKASIYLDFKGPFDLYEEKILKEKFDVRARSEEHTSELQSRPHLVCRLLLEKKKQKTNTVLLIQS